ncbi:hypothetical protein CW731_05050 [Polaribacter sp. ALD11]|uniref:hypothetical protein n=1 Tax=Polaribacter sp. ALD11 TaxID=2058137 RepID=UPI000C30F98D|nr:hypothetical protein [Polaribacter sp. ALD11]AUC84696.1 hypothetical protein CW731_05050 [Polaribacter sp. ALD11]
MMQSGNISNNESESQVLQKRSLEEINLCIEHLNFITEECDYLVRISSNNLNDIDLKDRVLLFTDENTNMYTTFLKYRNTVGDFLECIDLDCDLFYHNEHKKNRDLYQNHLENYREIKRKIFRELLV